MMEMVMGKMPDRFARAGARSKPEFFREGHKLDWPKAKATRQSKKDVKATRPLQVRHIPSSIYSHSTTSQDVIPPTDAINREFLDLVRKLLAFDPAIRLTVREALHHPYFSISIPPEI
jgi:dual-specificity kinase